jgi:hypothetical protein
MRRLAGARVLHPTAAHMRPLHEDVARARARLVGAQRILIFWPFCIVLTLLLCCGVNLCAMNDCFFCVDDAEFLSPCADEISVITLFFRAIFFILWLLWICRPKLPFVLVLKFLLDFNSISISNTE